MGTGSTTSGSQGGPRQGSLSSYVSCLYNNPSFTWLWLAETINTMGNWLKCARVLVMLWGAPRRTVLARPGRRPGNTPRRLHAPTPSLPRPRDSYVATLSLVDEFSESSGMALSGVVLTHFLPALVLAPVAGVVADRC